MVPGFRADRIRSSLESPPECAVQMRRIPLGEQGAKSACQTEADANCRIHGPIEGEFDLARKEDSIGNVFSVDNATCYPRVVACRSPPSPASFRRPSPGELRKALGLRLRQHISYSVQENGRVMARPEPGLDELFGSLKLNRPVASSRVEKGRARKVMAQEAAGFEARRRSDVDSASLQSDSFPCEPFLPFLGLPQETLCCRRGTVGGLPREH